MICHDRSTVTADDNSYFQQKFLQKNLGFSQRTWFPLSPLSLPYAATAAGSGCIPPRPLGHAQVKGRQWWTLRVKGLLRRCGVRQGPGYMRASATRVRGMYLPGVCICQGYVFARSMYLPWDRGMYLPVVPLGFWCCSARAAAALLSRHRPVVLLCRDIKMSNLLYNNRSV